MVVKMKHPTLFKQNLICPKCKHKNLGEDKFCEKCLFDLTNLNVLEYYMRWDMTVKGR